MNYHKILTNSLTRQAEWAKCFLPFASNKTWHLRLVYVLVRPFAFSLGSRNKRPISVRGGNLKCNTDCRLLRGMRWLQPETWRLSILHSYIFRQILLFFFLNLFWRQASQTEASSKVKKELLWGMEFCAAQTVLFDLGVPTSKGLPSPLPSTWAEKKSLVRRLVPVCVYVCGVWMCFNLQAALYAANMWY